jgi:hypothetical protein
MNRPVNVMQGLATGTATTLVVVAGVLSILATSNTSSAVTTITPSPTVFTTFDLAAAKIGIAGGPGGNDADPACTPATPPAPTVPAMPIASEVLVGHQDWRNTNTDASGTQCQSSKGRRWEGVVTFDMSSVVAKLNTTPQTLTGTLSYQMGAFLAIPSTPGSAIDLCVSSIEFAPPGTPAGGGIVPINGNTGATFPPTVVPASGAVTVPTSVPLGTITAAGPVTVDPAGPFPTVTVDISTSLLSEWAKTKPMTMSFAFVPRPPTFAQLAFPAAPIPVNRSTARCTSILKNFSLTIHVS